MLRCGIELYDRNGGQTIWQGMIWSAEVPFGNRVIGRTLETSANTVQVAYNQPDGKAARAPWAINTRHVAQYGIKELVGDLTDATESQALVYRDTLLASRGILPAPKVVSRAITTKNMTGRLLCVGLYKTLDWRYYTNLEAGLN